MAHFAKLRADNIVECVLVGRDEDDENELSAKTGDAYKKTSYNTVEGTHLLGGTPFRKNFAGIGYVYDPVRDAFYPPQPSPDHVLDKDRCVWVLQTGGQE
jgi:hypothetical protein